MSDQFSMFEPTTSGATSNATSSPELQFGATPSVSPNGPTTGKSGPDPAHVNPSARPVKAKRSTTKGIFGQSGFHSSKHEDLSFALANRLRPLTDSLGSTLFSLTWMTRITPAGRSISALRASEPLTEDSVFIGWPTPQKHDERERGNTMADNHYDLMQAASLTAWGTPAARDWRSESASEEWTKNRMEHPRGKAISVQALLAGWKTPCVPNGGRISGNKMDIGKHMDGTKAQIGLENEVRLGAWPTPMAQTPAQNGYNEAGNSDSSRKTVAMCQWIADQSTDSGKTPIGYLLGPNGWEIVPASGQLNAGHSRWLMGLPPEWDACGVTAMELLRKSRKRS